MGSFGSPAHLCSFIVSFNLSSFYSILLNIYSMNLWGNISKFVFQLEAIIGLLDAILRYSRISPQWIALYHWTKPHCHEF